MRVQKYAVESDGTPLMHSWCVRPLATARMQCIRFHQRIDLFKYPFVSLGLVRASLLFMTSGLSVVVITAVLVLYISLMHACIFLIDCNKIEHL